MSKKLRTYLETGFFPELLSLTEANYLVFGDGKVEKIKAEIQKGLILFDSERKKVIKQLIYENYLPSIITNLVRRV